MAYQDGSAPYNARQPNAQNWTAPVELPAPGNPNQPVELPATRDGYEGSAQGQHPPNTMPMNLPPGFKLVYDPTYQRDSSSPQTGSVPTDDRSLHSPVSINRESDATAGASVSPVRPNMLPPSYEAATSNLHLGHVETASTRGSISSQSGAQPHWPAAPQLSPQTSYQSSYAPGSRPSPQSSHQSSYTAGPPLSPQISYQSTYSANANAGPASAYHMASPNDQSRRPSAAYQSPGPQAPLRSPQPEYQMPYPNSGFAQPGPGYQQNYPPNFIQNPPMTQYPGFPGQANPAFQAQWQTTYSNVPPAATDAILQGVFSNLQISSPGQSNQPSLINLDSIRPNEGRVHKTVDTHHHALKALRSSSQTVSELQDVLGGYLRIKRDHEYSHDTGHGHSRRSRREIIVFNDLMQKLEDLSGDYISKEKGVPRCWPEAVGPHRRYLFAELYNQSDLVRSFCKELPNGPLAFPPLDDYALGSTNKNFNPCQAPIREANLRVPFEALSRVRTVFLIDDSGSMGEQGHSAWGGVGDTRWTQAQRMVAEIAPLVASYNPLGVDLHFLNRPAWYGGLTTVQSVNHAFQADWPNSGTPTGQRVHDILDSYLAALRYFRGLLMPLNLIVVTDGEAQDEDLLHWSIEEHVTKNVHRGFPAHQFGIEFIQVGDCRHATRHLVRLEEEVSRHHRKYQRDVVGVTPVTRQMGRMGPQEILGIAVSGIDARMNGYLRARRVNV